MTSFDVELLSINIHLQEIINLCVQKLSEDENYIASLSKDSFREILTVTISESFI